MLRDSCLFFIFINYSNVIVMNILSYVEIFSINNFKFIKIIHFQSKILGRFLDLFYGELCISNNVSIVVTLLQHLQPWVVNMKLARDYNRFASRFRAKFGEFW